MDPIDAVEQARLRRHGAAQRAAAARSRSHEVALLRAEVGTPEMADGRLQARLRTIEAHRHAHGVHLHAASLFEAHAHALASRGLHDAAASFRKRAAIQRRNAVYQRERIDQLTA